MNKWIAEFDLEDGDTMPEHMELNYMGAKIDFHCRPVDSCDGCKHKGKWENEVEYGYDSPCTFCKRRANDNYE